MLPHVFSERETWANFHISEHYFGLFSRCLDFEDFTLFTEQFIKHMLWLLWLNGVSCHNRNVPFIDTDQYLFKVWLYALIKSNSKHNNSETRKTEIMKHDESIVLFWSTEDVFKHNVF